MSSRGILWRLLATDLSASSFFRGGWWRHPRGLVWWHGFGFRQRRGEKRWAAEEV